MSWHRRGLAALAAALAVLSAVSAAMPEDPPTVEVVVARHEVRGGTVLAADDLELRTVLARDAPQHALTALEPLVGRTLAAPAAERQVLTDLALVSPRAAVAPGHVVAPLRLADAGLAALLRPGDVVDVLGADEQTAQARVVARAVRVVTIPPPLEETADSGALVLVEVGPTAATDLAQGAAAGALTVTWR